MENKSKRSVGWMGLKRGHRAHPFEWLAEQGMFLVSLSAIVLVFLIFLFVAREALPVLLGRTDSSLTAKIIPVSEMGKLKPAQLQEYLGLTTAQFKSLDREALQALME